MVVLQVLGPRCSDKHATAWRIQSHLKRAAGLETIILDAGAILRNLVYYNAESILANEDKFTLNNPAGAELIKNLGWEKISWNHGQLAYYDEKTGKSAKFSDDLSVKESERIQEICDYALNYHFFSLTNQLLANTIARLANSEQIIVVSKYLSQHLETMHNFFVDPGVSAVRYAAEINTIKRNEFNYDVVPDVKQRVYLADETSDPSEIAPLATDDLNQNLALEEIVEAWKPVVTKKDEETAKNTL